MKLIECYIENFGTFEQYTHKFTGGINCMVSDNGTGKSTLSMFILSMLYGMPDTKKHSLDENDRKKYAPWQGGRFGGTLTVEIKGKSYLLERSFGTKAADDTFKLYEKESGKESTDYTENLGEELFGIDRDGFMRTVFLSEKNLSVRNENKSISAKLSDLVGVEGDIGGFDEAKRLLDERRKVYYKQSDNCEIARVRAKIRTVRDEYDRLLGESKSLAEKESELTELYAELNRAKDEKNTLTRAALDEAKVRERYTLEKQYLAMLEEINKNEKSLKELDGFFGGEVPSAAEIERLRFSLAEGERIKKEEAREIGGEYLELSEIYGDAIDFDIISGAQKAHIEAVSLDSQIAEIENNRDGNALKMRELFPTSIPDKEEVEEIISGLGKSRSKAPLVTTIVGILLLLSGVLLGNAVAPMLYAFSAIGSVLFITGMLLRSKKESAGDKRAMRFITLLGKNTNTPLKLALSRILADVELYSELEKERKLRRETLVKRRDGIYDMLKQFTGTFNTQMTGDIEQDLLAIREGYSRFYRLKIENEGSALGRQTRLATADEMIRRAWEFTDKYVTTSADPFDEIARKVGDYNLLKLTLEKDKPALLEFKEKYSLTGSLPEWSEGGDEDKRDRLIECEARLGALTERCGILRDECDRIARDTENIDGVEAELEELAERLKKYTRIYEAIQKTSALLTEAYENMNSRYIGKTRESFLKYESAIGGDGGEYTVKTDFEVQKSERGAMHPEQSYSRGTRDLISLAMRLSLIDSLFEIEAPFIILDDPFIALDDKKIKKGRALLSELARGRQIIYFTCSEARKI